MLFIPHPTIKSTFVAMINGLETRVSKSSFGWSCGCAKDGAYIDIARAVGALIYTTRKQAENAAVQYVQAL